MTYVPDDGSDDDIDLTLRHLTQRFPDELARALLPDAISQAPTRAVTSRQRDALDRQLAREQPRAQEVARLAQRGCDETAQSSSRTSAPQ